MNNLKTKAALGIVLMILMVYAADTDNKSGSWTVRRFEFIGNKSFSDRQLIGLIELKPKLPFYNTRFSLSKLRFDIEAIEKYYRSKGYLFAKVSLDNIMRDSTKYKMFIRVHIDEGDLVTIRSVQIESERGHLDTGILNDLRTQPGKPLNSRVLELDEEKIINILNTKGYLKTRAGADIEIDTFSSLASVTFYVNEGPMVKVAEIQLEGVKKLKSEMVFRELAFKKGDTLDISKIRKTQKQLYRTDFFSIVQITPLFGDSVNTISLNNLPDSSYPVLVTVDESDFFRLSAGIGYGTSEGVRSSFRISYYNLFRLGHKITLKGNLSQRLQGTEVLYSTPWLLGIPIQLGSSLYFRRESDPDEDYLGVFRGGRISVGQQTDLDLAYQVWINYEDVNLLKTRNESPKNTNTQSIGISLTYDTRDGILDPKNGFLNIFESSVAGLIGKWSNKFVKITNDLRFHWNLGSLRLGSGLKLGLVYPYGNDPVPVQERFFGGGARSVRGFDEKHLREDIDGNSERGNFLATANLLECRFPLFWWFQGALFLDAGYVWDDTNNWNGFSSFNDLRWSAGPGIRLNTPIAVIRLDLGFKLDRKPSESLLQLHFDIGQPF